MTNLLSTLYWSLCLPNPYWKIQNPSSMRNHHILDSIPNQHRWMIRNSSSMHTYPMYHTLLESMSYQMPGPTNNVANSLSKVLMPLESLSCMTIQTFPILAMTSYLTIQVIPTLVKASCLIIQTLRPNQGFID